MVFRLAPDNSKDDDIRNNNSPIFIVGPTLPREEDAFRVANGLESPAREVSVKDDEQDDEASVCWCCCCATDWLWGRRPSNKVTPVRHPKENGTCNFTRIGDHQNSVLSTHLGLESLTLDSIDSINDSQLHPKQHAQPQRHQVSRTAAAPPAPHPLPLPHPLAPLELEDDPLAAAYRIPVPVNVGDYSTRSSGNGSANTSGSLVSVRDVLEQEVSRQASAVTSGYDSKSVSPDTDQGGLSYVGIPQGASEVTSEITEGFVATETSEILGKSGDTGTAEHEVDGDQHHVTLLQIGDDVGIPKEEPSQHASTSPERQPVESKRSEIAVGTRKQPVVRRTSIRPGRGVRIPLNRPRATTPGSLTSSGGASSLASLNLSSSLGNSTTSLFADSLPGFENPREALTRALQQLDSIEWEVTMQALQSMVRLVRHHPALVQGHLHTCCESLSRQVRNLRSQVARAACQASSHLFHALKRGMDAEAEDLSTALFNRTADTNKFLRADSNLALDAMTDSILPAKAVSAIVHKGCRHQNAVVRTAGARLLTRLVEKLGVDRVMSQPREIRDLLLLTSARLLMEGSLETRSYAKTLLKNLAQDHRLSMILVEIVPANIMRSIDKTLKSCLMRK